MKRSKFESAFRHSGLNRYGNVRIIKGLYQKNQHTFSMRYWQSFLEYTMEFVNITTVRAYEYNTHKEWAWHLQTSWFTQKSEVFNKCVKFKPFQNQLTFIDRQQCATMLELRQHMQDCKHSLLIQYILFAYTISHKIQLQHTFENQEINSYGKVRQKYDLRKTF